MFKETIRSRMKTVYYPLAALVVSLVLGGLLIAFLGFSPFTAYYGLLKGSVGSLSALCESLNKAVPIILTGLSFALANRCGLINLGAEGQFLMGAMCAVLAGSYVELPTPLHITVVVLAGFLGGALYGAIVGFLKNHFGANELIVTIMLNYIAASLVDYLIAGPLRAQSSQGNFPQSATVLETAKIPKIFPGVRLHAGILIALLALLLYFVFLWKTKQGYEMRVVGLNPTAAVCSGMSLQANCLMAMAFAGGFAGVAGAIELSAVQYRIIEGFSSNFGYDGIAVALLGNGSPIGIFLAGILLGALRAGANKMQVLTSVPSATLQIIQGMIILFVVGRKLFEIPEKHKGKHNQNRTSPQVTEGGKAL